MFGKKKEKRERTTQERLQNNQGRFMLHVVAELYILYMVYKIFTGWMDGEAGNLPTVAVFAIILVMLAAAGWLFANDWKHYNRAKERLEDQLAAEEAEETENALEAKPTDESKEREESEKKQDE